MELSKNWMWVIITFLVVVGLGGLQQCHYDNQVRMKRIEKGCEK